MGGVLSFEKKSERTIAGQPLWHIGKNAKGIIAIGDQANAMFAFGTSEASGTIYQHLQNESAIDTELLTQQLYQSIPKIYHWLVRMMLKFI